MLNTLALLLNLSMVLAGSYCLARKYFCYCYQTAWISISAFQLFFIPYILSATTILSYPAVFILNSVGFITIALITRLKFPSIPESNKRDEIGSILSLLLWGLVLYGGYAIAETTLATIIMPHARKVYPFNGDVLAGSMPLIVDIIQSGSLWTAKSDYGHYLNGYELIQSWGLIFLRNESVFGIVHYLFAFLLIFFSFKIFELLANAKNISRNLIYLGCQFLLFSCFFFQPLFPSWIFGPFGKTDLPSIAFVMMGIYFFLKTWLKEENYEKNLLLTLLSSCLFTAIKPQALYYFLFLFSLMLWQHFKVRHKSVKSFLLVLWPMIFSATLYMRFKLNMNANYVVAGTQSTLFHYFFMRDHTYLYSMFNDQRQVVHDILFGLNASNIIFYVCATMSLVLLLLLPFVSKITRLLFALFIGSFVGFLFAPLAIWYPCIQIRYSLAMMPLLFILMAYFAYYMLSAVVSFLKVKELKVELPHAPYFVKWIGPSFAIFLVVAVGLQVKNWKTKHDLSDFPGNRDVVFQEGIYQWVYNHVQNKKIYFFMARPFGLYGKELTNELFYDKNVKSDYGAYNPLRWADGIKQYQPDYFVYETYIKDPKLIGSVPPQELSPLLKAKGIGKFKVVYEDKKGIVIEVEKRKTTS